MIYETTIVRDGKRVEYRTEPTVRRRLPRSYYGKRLLEHGPLTTREFREITGWSLQVTWGVLENMQRTKIVTRDGDVWSLSGEVA